MLKRFYRVTCIHPHSTSGTRERNGHTVPQRQEREMDTQYLRDKREKWTHSTSETRERNGHTDKKTDLQLLWL